MRLNFTLSVFLMLLTPVSFANTTDTKGKNPDRELVWLSVDKDKLRASLYTLPHFPGDPVLLQTFRIAIGKEKGDKVRQGDMKTPEGIYFTLYHVAEEDLQARERALGEKKYGRLAIPLDFPNIIDRMDGKTGNGIWLHGAGDDNRIASENVTEGCVAFYNDDIVKLKNWLVPQQGVVLISSDTKTVNRAEDRKSVHELTETWHQSWGNRDLKTYINFYSPRFEHEGKNKAAYEKYKSRVFRSYKDVNLKTSTLRVLTHEKYAIAIMNQTFKGDDRYHSQGRKVLYWQKENNEWKIVRETFAKISLSKLDISQPNLQTLGPVLSQKP